MEYSVNTKPLLEDDVSDSGEDSPQSSSVNSGGGDETNDFGFPKGTEPRDW